MRKSHPWNQRAAIVLVLCETVLSMARSSAQPASAPAGIVETPALRLFRVRALLTVLTYEPKIHDAAVDESSRAKLQELMRRQTERVDADARDVARNAPTYDELVARGDALAREFDGAFAEFLQQHPDAAAAIQRQVRIDETVYMILASDQRDQLVQSALQAGLDPKQAGAARKLVADQYRALETLNEKAQREQEEMQRLPPDQQQMAMDLLMLEGQLELVRSGRVVRLGLLEMLTPEQRRVFDAKLEQLEPPQR